tara:strand:- start:1383 stop:1493 length:111 start_codon:yes stop_codon:yes gene_type:complete
MENWNRPMMTAVVLAATLSACDEQHSAAPEQPAPDR